MPEPVGRRRFVQGVTAVLSGALGTVTALSTLLPSRSWAVDLHVLSADQAATLLAMIHTIAPHDGLEEAAYALVVAAVDADAAASADAKSQIIVGLTGLGGGFARDTEPVRVQQLQAIEPSPFFQSIRRTTVSVLYNNPIAWEHFGYEGEAFSKGGYLLRGFNDLKWLPEVPPSASGPLPI